MKAYVHTTYGPPSVLQLKEVPIPDPAAQEVQVQVHATAINDYDWSVVRGKPGIYRLMFGLFKPKKPTPGMELAGEITAVGSDVTTFQVGDAVYGDISDAGFGTFAEYICVPEQVLIKKPDSMNMAEAASLSHAANLAYQGLFDYGKLKAGQELLINGAGGGVGTFAYQLALQLQVPVTGVDSGTKLEQMQSMGFDRVMDYKQLDFTKEKQKYDLILDAKTTRSPFAYLNVLKPGGRYVTIGGEIPRLIQCLLFSKWIKLFHKKYVGIVPLKTNKDLDKMHELVEQGALTFTIDGPHASSELPGMLQYFGEGKHFGKVIISFHQESASSDE